MRGRYEVTNATRGAVLAHHAWKATGPVRRGVGLIGKKSLPESGGLIIEPCNGVVSFFMRFPIDVLFLDAEHRVVHVLPRMVPWKASKIVRSSKRVVELPAGTVERSGTEVGDLIEIREV